MSSRWTWAARLPKRRLIEEGRIAYSSEYEVGANLSAGNRLVGGGGDRIRAPSIDLAEVGSGGGSIAALDRAGGLARGPRSAGAMPGPACYGRGGAEPTVTDANVVLGYIRAGKLANGDVTIDVDAAHRAIHDHIAAPLGMDVLRAAEGIHRIANARTMRALRAVSTERGRDPREFVLMGFGGSGPIHAAGLARELGNRRVIVPPLPGLFSAFGLLGLGRRTSCRPQLSVVGRRVECSALQTIRDELQKNLLAQFRDEGFPRRSTALTLDVQRRRALCGTGVRNSHFARYGGRRDGTRMERRALYGKYHHARCTSAFISEHERLYGHRSAEDNLIQVIAVRVVGQHRRARLH